MNRPHAFFPICICAVVLAVGVFGTACKKKTLTPEMAFTKIESIPEVQEYAAQLRKKGTQPSIRLETAKGQTGPLQFSVGESHQTHDVVWERFSIDPSSGTISAFDIESGEYRPLGEWREKQK